jgi:predicted nucleic acid-binding protein
MTVVSNSTALVHLSAMGRVDLLRELFEEVYIPEEVYQEVVVQGAGKPGAAEVQAAPWIKTQAVTNRLAFAVLNATLGAGEAACIVLTAEMGADLVILDDRLARLQAQTQGLKITGTVGILLIADEQGRLNFQQALDDLLATGFRLSPTEYQRVINLWKAKKGATP